MNRIWKHLSSWIEAYLVLPATILSIIGASYYIRFLTGRAPHDSIDWLADYSSVSMKAALIIVFTSAYKQASGSWLSLEQKISNPYLATLSDAKACFALLVFTYLFTH